MVFGALVLTSTVIPATSAAALPPAPDLTLAITAPSPVAENAPVLATLTVTNQGNAVAPAPVRVQITLTTASAGTATGTGWACAAPVVTIFTVTLTCTASQVVTPGASLSGLNVQATPHPKTSRVTILATVTDPGGASSNNSTMRDVAVLRTDLAADLRPPYTAIPRGGSVQLTAQINSPGSAPAPPPVVRLAASGFAAVVPTGTGWTCTAAPITCTAASGLGPGGKAPPLVVNATAANANAAGTLTATLANGDYNSTNDSSAALVAIGDHPDLETSVTASADTVKAGATAFFAVAVRNVGVLPQTMGIDVDIQSDGLQPVRASGTGWKCSEIDEEEISCHRTGTLAAGATAPVITVQGGVASTYPDDVGVLARSSASDNLNPYNDIDFATIDIAPDHALAISLDPIAPTASGQSVTFAAHVASVGSKSIDGPTTVAFQAQGATLSASGTGWSCASASCVATASVANTGTLPPLKLVATVTAAPGGRVNVNVSSTNDNDETDEDDTANQTMDVPITVVDTTPPTNVKATTVGDGFVTVQSTVRLAWTATDPSGIRNYDVELNHQSWRPGKAPQVSMFATATTATTGSLPSEGGTECIRVRARDNAGNLSAWSAAQCTIVPLSVSQFNTNGNWVRETRPDVFGGVLRTSTTRGNKLTLNVQARLVGVVATKCPTCGTFSVAWNGKVIANVDLRAPTTQRSRVVGLAILPALKTGTITLEVTSQGLPVPIEGLLDSTL